MHWQTAAKARKDEAKKEQADAKEEGMVAVRKRVNDSEEEMRLYVNGQMKKTRKKGGWTWKELYKIGEVSSGTCGSKFLRERWLVEEGHLEMEDYEDYEYSILDRILTFVTPS